MRDFIEGILVLCGSMVSLFLFFTMLILAFTAPFVAAYWIYSWLL
jgi:hypothetical protein